MTATAIRDPSLRRNMPGLLALVLASCLAVTTEMLPIGLLPAMGHALQVADSTTGLLVSLYAVMVATLAVPLTIATARFPRKPLVLSTLLCYALSNALVAAAPTFVMVAAGRALGGVTHALFFSLCIGYAPRLVGPAHVGRALALATGGASAGFVLGVPLSTSLGTALGWRMSFAALAALAAATLLLVAKFLPAVSSETPPRPAGTGSGRRQLTAVVTSNALTYLGQFTLYTFISVLLLRAGAHPALIGPLLLVCGACGLVGLWYAGSTLDRDPRRTTLLVLSVVVVAVLAIGLTSPALVPVLIAAAVWNGAFGGVPSIYQACAVRAQATSPELAGAWVNATANFGIAGGAAIGAGLLPVTGLAGLPWVGALLIALGLAVATGARRAFPACP
ncbi:MAG: conserved integral rane transport protein [Mycobacterium sp.]|nr:conserved integral rane transport protein [Mycobacterium sp.]